MRRSLSDCNRFVRKRRLTTDRPKSGSCRIDANANAKQARHTGVSDILFEIHSAARTKRSERNFEYGACRSSSTRLARTGLILLATAWASFLSVSPVLSQTPAAQPDGSVAIELNKVETKPDGACRAYLVVENGTAGSFRELKLDMVMFDTDGVVARRLAVQVAPLPAGKTSLKVFDIKGLPCEKLGRLLLNDVMTCADAAETRTNCLDAISTRSRGRVELIK